MRKGTCKHFSGDFRNTHCEAGICYKEVTPRHNESGSGLRLPCHQTCAFSTPNQLAEFEKRGTCSKYIEPTTEEIQNFDKVMDKAMADMMLTIPLCQNIKKEHKGKQWVGIVECPICKGSLHVSHSSYNGHVHGKCDTENCLNWME